MKNSSKNLKEFYANTDERFKGKFGYAFLATMITILPFAIILFGAAWLSRSCHWLFGCLAVIALVLVGCMQVGHIKFLRKLTEEENPSLKILFSGFTKKYFLMNLFLGIVMFFIYLISTILFVAPLIWAIGAFSMTFYFAVHHKYDNFLDALSTCYKRMKGHRANMFVYKFICYIIYFVLFVVFAIGIVFGLRFANPAVSILLLVLFHIVFFVLFSLITTWFSLCNYNFFIEVIDYNERKSKKAKQEINSADETGDKLAKVETAEESTETKETK